MKLYIWGTGKVSRWYMRTGEVSGEQLLGFIQTKRTQEEFFGKKVYELSEIIDTDYDFILVCLYYETYKIFNECIKAHIPADKVLLIDNSYEWAEKTEKNSLQLAYGKINPRQNEENICECFPKFFERVKERETAISRHVIISRNGYDLVEKDNWLQKEEFTEGLYQEDYCRYRTFELVAKEIKKANIEGYAAELGVFQGAFSRLINANFPQKELYLFDTFTSFDEAEFSNELNLKRCGEDFIDGFKDTSEEIVLEKMLYPEKCIIKKGLFPKTAEGLEALRFAFVSIDVDLEESVLEGMRYFFPRLNKGGAIFLHDYNNRFLEGVKAAVARFEAELGDHLIKTPIADEGGTLIIRK